MQQAKQPFCTRLQLLAWLALNAGKHTGNQPTRLAHLDDGNDRAILVQGDEGPAQVVRLGHQGTPSVGYSDDGAISSPPAPYHLSPGGSEIRTLGPPSCGEFGASGRARRDPRRRTASVGNERYDTVAPSGNGVALEVDGAHPKLRGQYVSNSTGPVPVFVSPTFRAALLELSPNFGDGLRVRRRLGLEARQNWR